MVSSGIIETVAGSGSGDNPAAPFAMFQATTSVAWDQLGNIFVSDSNTNRVHMIAPSGAISTVAGTGVAGYSGDNGPATSAELNSPTGLAVDGNGALYISDEGNRRVRKISGGIITTVVGDGQNGCALPTDSQAICDPQAVSVDPQGNLYFTSRYSQVFKVAAGVISVFAGNGTAGYTGDNGPAIAAELNFPYGLASDGQGNLYIADSSNNAIRRVDSNGIITTFAGIGSSGYSGDNGPATVAQLFGAEGVAVDSSGNVFIADTWNACIRVVTPAGTITTVGGHQYPGAGTGSPANAYFYAPERLVVDPSGNVYFVEGSQNRVQLMTSEGGPPLLTIVGTYTGFELGSTAQWTFNVFNAPLAGPTSGTVTVTEYVPNGVTISSMSGNGWTCGPTLVSVPTLFLLGAGIRPSSWMSICCPRGLLNSPIKSP
jgi:trimeric autotransporter adhesin